MSQQNAVVTIESSKKMSSREIAELMNKEHKHVCRDIRQQIKVLVEKAKEEKYSQMDEGFPEHNRSSRKQYKYVKPSSAQKANDNLLDGPYRDHSEITGIYEEKDARGYIVEYLLCFDATMTLITGYDAVRRAMVIKRWRELETGEAKPAYQLPKQKKETVVPVDREFRAALRMAKAVGLVGNQAIISASQLAKKITGQDPLLLLETKLPAEKQELHYNASELGALAGYSGAEMNLLLEKSGMQQMVVLNGKKVWRPTERGKLFSVMVDTGKRHHSGMMVQQVRWYEEVLGRLTEQTRKEKKR